MASFENDFYEKHAIKVNEQKFSEKFHVAYMPEGSTPDGYQVYESLTIETGKGAVEIYRDGSAVYTSGGNETENSIEAYSMLGIDTDSKEFKQFQTDIQKSENYNVQTVEKMLETVPQLTAEKQIEKLNAIHHESVNEIAERDKEMAQFKENFVNAEIVKNLSNEVENKGFTKEQIQELAEDIWEKQSWIADDKEMEQAFVETVNENLIEKGYKPLEYQALKDKEKTQLAEPGRAYTGAIISIDEDKTVQQTKSGVAIIHETKNLPGIEDKDIGKTVNIDYSQGKEAVIEQKASGLERSKSLDAGAENTLEHDNDFGLED